MVELRWRYERWKELFFLIFYDYSKSFVSPVLNISLKSDEDSYFFKLFKLFFDILFVYSDAFVIYFRFYKLKFYLFLTLFFIPLIDYVP